jgi:hypothetical protein
MNYIDNNSLLITKLENQLFKHGKLIIGLDFDSTLYDYDPDNSVDTSKIVKLAQQCAELGFDICLWTIVNNKGLDIDEKVAWCTNKGITISHVNASPMDNDPRFKGNRKPYFNVLLDDNAGLDSAYHALKYSIRHLI